MSCNGCRVLPKGCSESCVLRPCIQWIESPEAQGHAIVFVAKFFGRAGLMSFISAVPETQRPALFQSLLYEACGRTINPVNGSVGLLTTGNWSLCQAAVVLETEIEELKVLGNADPWMLRDHVEATTHQKVEIISIKDPKISKELVASTVVLKMSLNCHGSSESIKKTIFKVKGVYKVSVDNKKDLVTVKGTMNLNSLPTKLEDMLKHSVEIVSAKNDGGDKKEKTGDDFHTFLFNTSKV